MGLYFNQGKDANIYTDSKYAFRVAHDFGMLWKQCSLLLAEMKFKNGSYVQKLLDAICLPAALAIIKIPGHCKLSLWKLRGITLLIFPQGIFIILQRTISGQTTKGIFPQMIT